MSVLETAKNILSNNLSAKSEESILIITDDSLTEIANIFYKAAKNISNKTIIAKMPVQNKSGEEPPHMIASLMKTSDVVLYITEHSLTHTQARLAASKAGARIATMPGITKIC